jgi:hypothetical protein
MCQVSALAFQAFDFDLRAATGQDGGQTASPMVAGQIKGRFNRKKNHANIEHLFTVRVYPG